MSNQDKINAFPLGSTERLEVIAQLNMGSRSEAAKRVLEKRAARVELMQKGLSFSQACMIVSQIKTQ